MDSSTFLALSLCIISFWLYRTPSHKNVSKTLIQAVLLTHSLYQLHTLLVTPPRNVFSELGLPATTPCDTLRALYIHRSPDGDLDPELDALLQKLNSFDIRVWYLQLGHDTVSSCDFCHSFSEYASFSLIRPILGYILSIALIGLLTLPGTPHSHLRSFGIGVLILALVAEVFATLTTTSQVVLSAPPGSLLLNWHTTIHKTRTLLFLLLPLTLHSLSRPLSALSQLPILSSLLPTPDPRLTLPPSAQRLQSLQTTLSHLLTRIHLLTYTRSAIMRLPATRTRAAEWWDAEEHEGTVGLADEGVKRTARGMGLAYEAPEDVLRVNAKKGLESLVMGVLPSEHWVGDLSGGDGDAQA